MKLIKLDAIDSTNDFLKALSQNQEVENFTVVTTNEQFKGKGQMGAIWLTESGKNLISSVLIKGVFSSVHQIFELNIAVAIAILTALEKKNIPNLSIKWANDILSENKKIAGILIENNFKSDSTIESIVGIGLNVNQENFDGLPQATSLKNIMNEVFNIDDILFLVVEEMKKNIQLIVNHQSELLWQKYHEHLFKIGKPTVFENSSQGRFMGIIKGVTKNGQLELLLEDDTVRFYAIKEIAMLY